jgi:hypothetical protein
MTIIKLLGGSSNGITIFRFLGIYTGIIGGFIFSIVNVKGIFTGIG